MPRPRDVEKERVAVQMRRDGATYAQIGHALGVSRARAHQIVSRALGGGRRARAWDEAEGPPGRRGFDSPALHHEEVGYD